MRFHGNQSHAPCNNTNDFTTIFPYLIIIIHAKGAMVDKNLLPWNWGASDGKGADECLIKIVPNLTIDYPTGGIAWGVVCMEGSHDFYFDLISFI